jgi:hypothetical protein
MPLSEPSVTAAPQRATRPRGKAAAQRDQNDRLPPPFLKADADFPRFANTCVLNLPHTADIVAARGCRPGHGALSQTVPTDAGGNLTDRDRPEWEHTQNPSDGGHVIAIWLTAS